MSQVFISYRRDDTRGDAGRLHDRLASRFGPDRVFMDVQDIGAGDDFEVALHRTLEQSSLLIVLIGTRWRGDVSQNDRLAEPGDYVRLEIEAGLERRLKILPVLVGNAEMPSEADLPPGLESLSKRQAFAIREDRYDDDVELLMQEIDELGLFDGASSGEWLDLRSEPRTLSVLEAKALCVSKGLHTSDWTATATGPPSDYESVVVDTDIFVRDGATGLAWEHGGSTSFHVHDDARERIRAMNERSWGGHGDWRLPTLEEALSLVRPVVHRGHHLDPIFDAQTASIMWTADRTENGGHWVIYFVDGICRPEGPSYNAMTKAVRRSTAAGGR